MKCIKNSKGFTFIEVLVALAILSVMIVPLTGMFSESSQINLKAGKDTVAMTVAKDIMNRIKAGDLKNFHAAEKEYYKDTYGVEPKVEPSNLDTITPNLQEVKVYVAPSVGMDPKKGVVLSSYLNKSLLENDSDETENGGNGNDENDDGGNNPGDDGVIIPEDDYWDWYDDFMKNNTNGWVKHNEKVMPLYIHDTQNGNTFTIDGVQIQIRSAYDSIKLLYEVISRADSNGNGKVNPHEFTVALESLCNITYGNVDLTKYSRDNLDDSNKGNSNNKDKDKSNDNGKDKK